MQGKYFSQDFIKSQLPTSISIHKSSSGDVWQYITNNNEARLILNFKFVWNKLVVIFPYNITLKIDEFSRMV